MFDVLDVAVFYIVIAICSSSVVRYIIKQTTMYLTVKYKSHDIYKVKNTLGIKSLMMNLLKS